MSKVNIPAIVSTKTSSQIVNLTQLDITKAKGTEAEIEYVAGGFLITKPEYESFLKDAHLETLKDQELNMSCVVGGDCSYLDMDIKILELSCGFLTADITDVGIGCSFIGKISAHKTQDTTLASIISLFKQFDSEGLIYLSRTFCNGKAERIKGKFISNKFEELDMVEREGLIGDLLDSVGVNHADIGIIQFITHKEYKK